MYEVKISFDEAGFIALAEANAEAGLVERERVFAAQWKLQAENPVLLEVYKDKHLVSMIMFDGEEISDNAVIHLVVSQPDADGSRAWFYSDDYHMALNNFLRKEFGVYMLILLFSRGSIMETAFVQGYCGKQNPCYKTPVVGGKGSAANGSDLFIMTTVLRDPDNPTGEITETY